ncbi:hypothetical protein K474DRAFT_1600557, partial [Panus rudis PR-1116 ss-1]
MSLSDYESDLTELTESEDDYKPAASAGKKKQTKKQEYRIVNALRPPRTTQYTAKSLYDQIVDGLIDLDPEYQREVVWPETKQVSLIDSILRNYYIPPIIFAVTVNADGSEMRTCIDGKQRLTSIQKYTNQRFYYKQDGSGKKPLLPRQYMQAFANKQIVCVEYEALSDDQEREIFQRVQNGVALTPAGAAVSPDKYIERMQALTGPWPSLVRSLQNRIASENGFGDSLEWGSARGREFQCIASMVYTVTTKPTPKFPSAASLNSWLQRHDDIDPHLRESLEDAFDIYMLLSKDKKYNSCFSMQKVSPIEWTMTGILIYREQTRLTMAQLSLAIIKLREDVRKKFLDVRSNSRVASAMMAFI